MPEPKTEVQQYRETCSAAVALIVLACQHNDQGQRHDMIKAGTELFWYAARQTAFTAIKRQAKGWLDSGTFPEEILAVAGAAVHNIDKLRTAVERCATLMTLLKEPKSDEQA